MENIIEVKNLTKSYKNKITLNSLYYIHTKFDHL